MPVYVHVVDHPVPVLVDTGMTELRPAVADLDHRLCPLSEQDFDLAGIDVVVNTHLHFDHCGGNHLIAGKPIYVQRRGLDDARGQDNYTIRRRAEPRGVRFVPVDGERPASVQSSSAATWRFGSASLTRPAPRASCECARARPRALVWRAHEHEAWRPRRPCSPSRDPRGLPG